MVVVSVCLKVAEFLVVLVIVQGSKTLVAEEAGVLWCVWAVVCNPPEGCIVVTFDILVSSFIKNAYSAGKGL